MKVAIITEAAGAPTSLATTAFVGALAEGLTANGAEVLVVGTTAAVGAWIPEALGNCRSAAPWLNPPEARLSHGFSAVVAGVLGPTPSGCAAPSADEWHQELLLDREIRAFAGTDGSGVLIVYPRSYAVHRAAVRVADRLGWRVVAVSTEALTDNQIDPRSRDDYARCIVACEDGVWALSTHLADDWHARGVDWSRLHVNPAIIRGCVFGVSGGGEPGSAVYLGNLAHREIEYLLDISDLVRRKVPGFRLTVYGDALPDRRAEIEATVRARSLGDVVDIRAAVPPAMVPEVLVHARLALLPRSKALFSDAGFPNKLGEYLAAGRAVVVTRVGDIPNYLSNGVDAVLVPPDDVDAFAEAVVTVLSDEAHADAMSVRGREVAVRFRSDAVAARILTFIETLPMRESMTGSEWVIGRCGGLLRLPSIYVPMVKRSIVRMLRLLHLKPQDPLVK